MLSAIQAQASTYCSPLVPLGRSIRVPSPSAGSSQPSGDMLSAESPYAEHNHPAWTLINVAPLYGDEGQVERWTCHSAVQLSHSPPSAWMREQVKLKSECTKRGKVGSGEGWSSTVLCPATRETTVKVQARLPCAFGGLGCIRGRDGTALLPPKTPCILAVSSSFASRYSEHRDMSSNAQERGRFTASIRGAVCDSQG